MTNKAAIPPTFNTLNRLSIQQVWASESHEFAPWLTEHLDYLAERIGLDLELVATELPVGPFRVDLVAQVTGTDDLVVVENQFGPTDHDHHGGDRTTGYRARGLRRSMT